MPPEHDQPGPAEEGFIIEFHPVGNSVRVSAFDPATLTEVTLVGAPSLSEEQLATAAIRKLRYVLAKKSGTSMEPK
jgi:hypothetical protein